MSEGNRVALIVACDRYADTELGQLQAPSQDAQTLQRILEDTKIGGFKVTPLINQPHWTVTEKINEFLQSCNMGDTVLLYFSCHGIKDKDGRLYFATLTTNRKLLLATGIPSNFLNEVLDHCRAQQKVVLLDCCYSGAFEKGRVVRADEQVNATGFFGEGSVVITASDSMQYAFEGDEKKELGRGGSYFTDALIDGLETGKADVNNDGKITYYELYKYIYDHVRKITPDQTPTLNAHEVKDDFEIFKNVNASSSGLDVGALAESKTKEDIPKVEAHEVRDPILELVDKALMLLEEGQYEDAVMIFNSILTIRSEHVEALNGKGMALYKQKKYNEASECFEKVLKIKPRHVVATDYLEMIRDRINKKRGRKVKPSDKDIKQNKEQGKRLEQKVIEGLKESTEILAEKIKRGEESYEKGNYEEAIRYYDEALEMEPRSELAWYNKGNALDKKRDYEGALFCFREALKINTDSKIYRDNIKIELGKLGRTEDDAKVLYNKGLALFDSGKYEESIEYFDRAIKIDPNNADSWYNKGNALNSLGKYEEALTHFGKAIELNPNNAGAWHSKGQALGYLGRYEEAIKCYEKSIELNPNNAKAWYNKGSALDKKGDHEEALSCFKQALRINPGSQMYRDNIRRMELKLRSGDNSLHAPEDPEAWNNKGVELYMSQRYEESIEYFDRAIKIDPSYEIAWYNKGNALQKLQRYEEAIEYFDRAIKIDPNDTEAQNEKRIALQMLEMQKYEEALKINPNDAAALYNKGLALFDSGKYEESIEYFDRAIKIDPSYKHARRYIRIAMKKLFH